MADSRVASRYVKSLLGLAVQQGVVEPVHQDMQLFAQVCRNSRDFVLMLKSPIVRHEKKARGTRNFVQRKSTSPYHGHYRHPDKEKS
jgi:F0F1-type ATP synthase delta subunit